MKSGYVWRRDVEKSTVKTRGETVSVEVRFLYRHTIFKIMEVLKQYTEGWYALLSEIANNYSDGTLIPHEWLKEKLGLKELSIEDFDSVADFVEGIKIQQFAYMSFVDAIRWQLLDNEKIYLRNIRGDGYVILNPKDQTKYGYDKFIKDVRKAMDEAGLIMNNVKPVPLEQQSKDNDMRAKFSIMQTMLSTIR